MNDTAAPGRVVDVWADVLCPFAHVSLRRFTERRRERGADGVRLRVRAWPLELVNGDPLEATKVTDEIADLRSQVAADLFAGFDPATFPSGAIAALGASTLAYESGVDTGEAFNLALRDALFEDGQAIGEPAVLGEIAARFDLALPADAVARSAVEADFAAGKQRGVTGSPYFVVDGVPFFCPTLDIERRGARLHIEIDDDGSRRFVDHAFRA